MIVVLILCIFFCFKQKTAYEMRISDWSSDVCSSELAHFLEHMAFNGSTHVPEGEMIKLLERKGLAFGADTNASTGFDETIYKLDLPNASDDLPDTGLMLMRETASETPTAPPPVAREPDTTLSEQPDAPTTTPP